MSFSGVNTSSQRADVNSHRLSDLFHIRQLERQLKQALEELEQVRTRVNQLEQEIAFQNTDGEKTQISQQAETIPAVPPLPIAEIKQLAEMAKRFR